MTKKEVLQTVYGYLANELKNLGFKYIPKQSLLLKEDNNAFYTFQVLAYNRTVVDTQEKGWLLEPDVWITVKSVEEVYKEITVNKVLVKLSDFLTLGNSLANLQGNPDGINKFRNQSFDIVVFNEMEIIQAQKNILNAFNKIGLNYFNKYGNIESADLLLNQHPKDYNVHMSNDSWRFIKGIISAKLNDNPALPDLISTYYNKMKEWKMSDRTQEEWNNLMAILPMIGTQMKF